MQSRKQIEKRLNYLTSISQQIDESLSNKNEVEYKKEEIEKMGFIPDPLTLYLEKEEKEYLRYLIYNRLSNLERTIICMSFGIDCQKYYGYEIVKKLNITKRMFRLIQKNAFSKLKTYLENDTLTKKSSR